eukprot:Phypoly_transcript_14022.p1 GENE.Phypoly_transcript_14022~~Phypoly_transcript_14022.p1  ORF type:complete len:268 (+),score=49.08 Phypoly_transcript_14022:181-984(+)
MSGQRYKDKVTIVTGGSKGIGEGCVRVFLAEGSKVLFCSRTESEGKALEAELSAKYPGNVAFVKCDVSKPEQIQHVIDKTIELYGKIDCLINNAGWHPPHKTIDEFSIQEFRDLFDLNMVSMFAACKFALPHLRKTKGNIINLSSLVGQMGQLHAVTYVATKGAITAFTKALAVDEASNGVRVNAVSPGNIWTPMWAETADSVADPQKFISDSNRVQWMGRMGTIEESGKLCLFIAAEATFTTGVDHLQTGGAELAYGSKPIPPPSN